MASEARTLLFGGTFDPVHNAHLEIAREAARRFGLSRVLFIPAASPPHKPEDDLAPFEDRFRMVELACAGEMGFEVSRIEAPAPWNPGQRSYSIDTIGKLRAAGMDALWFLIGADAFAEIRTWHRWRELVELVEFIVVDRPGWDQEIAAYEVPPGARLHRLTGLSLPESSSDIRRRLALGDDDVPVPAPVLHYIREHGLYR